MSIEQLSENQLKEKQLIEEFLKNNEIKKYRDKEPTVAAYTGKEEPTGHKKYIIDHTGKKIRKYDYLDKGIISGAIIQDADVFYGNTI